MGRVQHRVDTRLQRVGGRTNGEAAGVAHALRPRLEALAPGRLVLPFPTDSACVAEQYFAGMAVPPLRGDGGAAGLASALRHGGDGAVDGLVVVRSR